MWEAIAANRRRSRMLILCMGFLLVVLGGAIGGAVGAWQMRPGREARLHVAGGDATSLVVEVAATQGDAIVLGMLVAVGLWLVLWMTAEIGGDSILLGVAGARQIEKQDAPLVWDVVEEMTIAAGLPQMPSVYLIDDPAPNAFAVGRNPKLAAVAITTGLIKRLTRDELQGVVAHEIGHVNNQDVRFMTLAVVMVGAIAMLGGGFLRGVYYGGGGRRRSSEGNGAGGAAAILMVAAIVMAIVAPIAARLLYFACSRRREYLADACSARYTRYPEGLASALEKIGRASSMDPDAAGEGNAALAPLYIVNPRQALTADGPFSTHPPLEDRVRVLRAMTGGAGFGQYDAAFRAAHGAGGAGVVGGRTLAEEGELVGLREPTPEAKPDPGQQAPDAVARARQAVGVFDRAARVRTISCPCGLAIKLPPDWKDPQVRCPRCGRQHALAEAEADAGS
jgi:heat shock protein HtpX